MPDAPPAEEKKLDPFVDRIVKSMGNVINPQDLLKPQDSPTEPAAPTVAESGTLGEAVVLAQERRKKATEAPADNAPAAHAPAPAAPAAPPPATPAAPAAEPVRPVIKLVQKPAAPAAPPPTRPEPPPAKKPEEIAAEKADAEYIKTLTPEQQEQIAIARFAESKGKTGTVQQLLSWFRKFDQFLSEHPEIGDEGSEELTKFTNENAPKFDETDWRRYERDMIRAEAVRDANEQAESRFKPIEKELREIRTSPAVEKAVAGVEMTLISPHPTNKEIVPIAKAVSDLIKSKGYEAALAKYPVEAPIVDRSLTAADQFLRLVNNLVDFNDTNPVHAWILEFIIREDQAMMAQPESVRTVDGRTFVPRHVYTKLAAEQSPDLDKYWTRSNDDIVALIGQAGLRDYNAHLQTLTRAGWKREVSGTDGNPANSAPPARPVSDAPEAGSPKAGARTTPGAADTDVPANENDDYFGRLLGPDHKKIRNV